MISAPPQPGETRPGESESILHAQSQTSGREGSRCWLSAVAAPTLRLPRTVEGGQPGVPQARGSQGAGLHAVLTLKATPLQRPWGTSERLKNTNRVEDGQTDGPMTDSGGKLQLAPRLRPCHPAFSWGTAGAPILTARRGPVHSGNEAQGGHSLATPHEPTQSHSFPSRQTAAFSFLPPTVLFLEFNKRETQSPGKGSAEKRKPAVPRWILLHLLCAF